MNIFHYVEISITSGTNLKTTDKINNKVDMKFWTLNEILTDTEVVNISNQYWTVPGHYTWDDYWANYH